MGTRSHLFITKTQCLCRCSRRTRSSMYLQRVPMGSLASRTSMITSEESTTCKIQQWHNKRRYLPQFSPNSSGLTFFEHLMSNLRFGIYFNFNISILVRIIRSWHNKSSKSHIKTISSFSESFQLFYISELRPGALS